MRSSEGHTRGAKEDAMVGGGHLPRCQRLPSLRASPVDLFLPLERQNKQRMRRRNVHLNAPSATRFVSSQRTFAPMSPFGPASPPGAYGQTRETSQTTTLGTKGGKRISVGGMTTNGLLTMQSKEQHWWEEKKRKVIDTSKR